MPAKKTAATSSSVSKSASGGKSRARVTAALRKAVKPGATKATATKSVATKKAAKKAVAKKTTPKKTPATKAPAKKTAAKKTPAPKPAGKKTPATSSATKTQPAAKVPATRKTTAAAAKAAPTKKAATKTTADKTAKATTKTSATPRNLKVRDDESPWTPKELAAVRAELESDVERLTTELSGFESDIAGLIKDSGDGAGDDQADAGAKTFEREHEYSLAQNSRDLLEQSVHALERIDDGTYGVCENCGNAIGKLRLQAFPRATLCLTCKAQQERR